MRKQISFIVLAVIAGSLFGQRAEVTFGKAQPVDHRIQQELRQSREWSNFDSQHGDWWVEFNEQTQLPHRAMGQAIVPSEADLPTAARNHLLSYLGDPSFPLTQKSVLEGKNGAYVHFEQRYEDLKVWFSHALVRFNNDGHIIMFGLDVYPDIKVNTTPTISSSEIVSHAQVGLSGSIINADVAEDLGVLAMPQGTTLSYHLVYEVMVETMEENELPGRYFTLVDAHDGKVLYRMNRVHSCLDHVASQMPMAVDADIEASITDNPLDPTTVRGLPHLRVRINSTNYYTDENGHLNENLTAPVNATVFLEGPYAKVLKDIATQVKSFNTTLQPGTNTITFGGGAGATEVSAYYHVNVVHDYMKSITDPGFTTLDVPMTTKVDVAGTCNANYNGSSINFFAAGGGCPAAALFRDIIYHEYGHGINYDYYDYLGGNFANPALGEGYADMWGLMITEDPVLARGFHTSPTTSIRRYDQEPKVYPQDLAGESHADGEIIAGAWWDTYVNLGNDMTATASLFIESHNGLAMAPSGAEGRLYRDILVDVLLADDDDGNISNGTPNSNAILTAFARHGITLLTNAIFYHQELDVKAPNEPIEVNASVLVETAFVPFVGDLSLFYRTSPTSPWAETTMPLVSGNTHTGQIPAQPKGTIVDYYIALTDIFGNTDRVVPFLANAPSPNLPYQILVGYKVKHLEDFDNNLGDWVVDPFGTDLAITGQWEINFPVPSYTDAGTIVQPGTDHTIGTNLGLCTVTGNAVTASTSYGANDIDSGHTTMRSPIFDLTPYSDPAIAYWRWYTNNQGANPGNDVWQVFISDDQVNWVRIERTDVTDRSWRRKAFRVKDYVDLTPTVSLLFLAQDSVMIGEFLNGGSIVEAAVDDLYIYDESETIDPGIGISSVEKTQVSVYPNPASGHVTVGCDGCLSDASLQLSDVLGHVLIRRTIDEPQTDIDISGLPPAVYLIRVSSGEHAFVHRLMVE